MISVQTDLQKQQSNGTASRHASRSDLSSTLAIDSKTNLIINYLPQSMTQDEVKALFLTAGEVESCKLVRDKVTGQSFGYGFVKYFREEDALQAVKMFNGLKLQNKNIKVSFARPSSESIKGANLYVSGLPRSMVQNELEELFLPFGQIITSRILSDTSTGISKGVGFVRFDKREEAETAIAQLNGKILAGFAEAITVKFANSPATTAQKNQVQISQLQIAQAMPSLMPIALLNTPTVSAATGVSKFTPGPIHRTSQSGRFRYSPLTAVVSGSSTSSTASSDLLTTQLLQMAASGAGTTPAQLAATLAGATTAVQSVTPTGFCVFIYNLAPETEESALWQLFGPFGAVLNVKVIRELSTGKCKGYGFVTMARYEEALTAIASLNGLQHAGRTLQVPISPFTVPTSSFVEPVESFYPSGSLSSVVHKSRKMKGVRNKPYSNSVLISLTKN